MTNACYRSRICDWVYHVYNLYKHGFMAQSSTYPRSQSGMAGQPSHSLLRFCFAVSLLTSCFLLFSKSVGAIILPVQNITNLGVDGDCVAGRDWVGSNGYVASDCHQAIQRFLREELYRRGDEEVEFLAPRTAPLHTLPTVRTPRRYTVCTHILSSHIISTIATALLLPANTIRPASCTLVIAMLGSRAFPAGSIPNMPPRSLYPADTSNLPSIRNMALQLEDRCIDDDMIQYGGWQSVGSRNSIGVFLWSTLSVMNWRVGRAVNVVLDLKGLNETVVGEEFGGTALGIE